MRKNTGNALTNNKNIHICALCGSDVNCFLPYAISEKAIALGERYHIIGSDVRNFSCPKCYSTDRERHLFFYFNALNIWDSINDQANILHIAPERLLSALILDRKPANYIMGDLFPENSPIKGVMKVDITKTLFNDNSFDIIIANHILEHVPDDVSAMREIYRILKKDGIAILQTPYSPKLDETYEDDSIVSDIDREEHFGQNDHVRIYSERDLFNKLTAVGFILDIHKSSEFFTKADARKYGFNHEEDLILCLK